jgi:peptidoglycan/LPS O-acetylase OafA/YrhL
VTAPLVGQSSGVHRPTLRQRFDRTFFSQAPASGESLPALDGIRALAVIAIFARHAWGLTGQYRVVVPLAGGDLDLSSLVVMMSNGVDLFFVLSGFLLARAFISADARGAPAPSLRRYFRQRFFRIVPAYWVVLFCLLVFFVPATVQPDLVYSAAGIKTVLSHVVMLQTAFPWSYGMWGPASPFWTLTIEVIFYLLVPWLSRMFFRNRWVWGLPVCAAVTFGWMWFVRSGLSQPLVDLIVDRGGRAGASDGFARFFLSKQFPGHLFDFAIGMTVASLYVRAKQGNRGRLLDWLSSRAGSILCMIVGGVWVLVSMRQLGILTLTHTYYDGLQLMAADSTEALAFYYFEEPSMAVGFGLLILGAVLGPASASRAFSVKPLRFLGIIGYSIYLWHMPFLYQYAVMPWIMRIAPGPRWVVMMVLVGSIVVIVSAVTYAFVERPFINFGRRRPATLTSTTGAVAGSQAAP